MNVTDRDRKIMLLLVPLIVFGAYWFLLLAPKREEAATAQEDLVVQEQRRDDAEARAASLAGARTSFAADYAELVRLGKAVPTSVDMPTVLVQLEDAARGTKIKFIRITAQEREAAPAAATPPPGTDEQRVRSRDGRRRPGAERARGSSRVRGQHGRERQRVQRRRRAVRRRLADTQTSRPPRTARCRSAVAPRPGPPGQLLSRGARARLRRAGAEFTGNFLDLSDFFHRSSGTSRSTASASTSAAAC